MGTPAVSNVPGYIISKLEGTFIESLNIQDALKLEHAYEVDRFDNLYVEEENLSGGFEPQETKLEIKCLKDCSTFSYSDICLPSSCSDEETDKSFSKQSRQNYCSVSLEVSC